MCLAIPALVVKIKDDGSAIVDYGGVEKAVNIDFVSAKIGDFVLVHAGFAIQVLDKQAAIAGLEQARLMIKNG